MRFLFLLICVAASAAFGQGRDINARCRRPCQALVVEPRQRATLCGLCGAQEDPMGWLLKLSPVPRRAFLDDDWLVRWTAVRADALATSTSSERRLAAWVEASVDDERRLACLTRLLASGTLSGDALLSKEPRAAALCQGIADAVWQAGLLELLAVDRRLALEALQLLSKARAVGPARVVLDLMASRTPEFDEQLAELLVSFAEHGGTPVGLTLLRDAREPDAPLVDRLLAVYSRLRDRKRSMLSSSDKDARLQGVLALAPLAPLSASELLIGLSDEHASIRMASARAIARGEGRTLTEAAEVRLSGAVPVPAMERRRWLTLLADVDDPRCVTLTTGVWRDGTQPDAVRADALVSLAGCGRRAALSELVAASKDSNAALQAGVMRAVLLLPREPQVAPLVEKALTSSTDEVLAGAAAAIGAHRLTPLRGKLTPLTNHPAAIVRVECLQALWMLDARATLPLALDRLSADSDPTVRGRAALLLPELGGPQAVAALARASKRDTDSHVKMAALEGLRRLGITP